MSADLADDEDSSVDLAATPRHVDAGPLGVLPRLSARRVALEGRLSRLEGHDAFSEVLGGLVRSLGQSPRIGPPEVFWKPAGLRRTGLVAQILWPRLRSRLAIGIEIPVAHAVVDRLLGFDRFPEEHRLALTPIEWGIWTYLIADCLNRLQHRPPGPFGAWDLEIDRVGPDPFDLENLGRVVTLRWPVALGEVTGAFRLWLPEILVARWLQAGAPPLSSLDPERASKFAELSGDWHAVAGTIVLPRGLKTLRLSGVLPLIDSRLRGSPQSPSGVVTLIARTSDRSGTFRFSAEPVPFSGAGRLTLTSVMIHEPLPREALPVNPASTSSAPSPEPGADVPISLVVELGRVQLTMSRLADLHPGDVIELGRHSREPVELTSNGRLVARGELVQIDTELGVRVTNLFL